VNIKDFKKAKREMEEEIQKAVLLATLKFWGETGYTPHSIGIDMHEKIALGSKSRQYIVGAVRAEVEL